MSGHHIIVGSVLEVLRGLPADTFDACLCDPPYGFSFMGQKWDYSVPPVAEWAEVMRVLKPGAPLVAFGGSRTYHRLACGVEDAGFELRDQLMWLYGKGFPKSQNVSLALDRAAGATREVVGTRVLTGNAALTTAEKGGTYGVQVGSAGASKEVDVTAPATELARLWDGWETALKPAHEPIALARKPLDGTMAENIARWGVGGLAIDECRVGTETVGWGGGGRGKGTWNETTSGLRAGEPRPIEGRWPANLILDEEAGALLDASVAPTKSGKPRPDRGAGGPSRFFYCAKVSTREREAGCEHLPRRTAGEVTNRGERLWSVLSGDQAISTHDTEDEAQEAACQVTGAFVQRENEGLDSPRAGAGRTGGARNHHPTLKPIALTKWLATLIKGPTPRAILVPWSGAGSEMIGAALAGWPHVLGIEREEEYAEIARARLAHWLAEKKEGI